MRWWRLGVWGRDEDLRTRKIIIRVGDRNAVASSLINPCDPLLDDYLAIGSPHPTPASAQAPAVARYFG